MFIIDSFYYKNSTKKNKTNPSTHKNNHCLDLYTQREKCTRLESNAQAEHVLYHILWHVCQYHRLFQDTRHHPLSHHPLPLSMN